MSRSHQPSFAHLAADATKLSYRRSTRPPTLNKRRLLSECRQAETVNNTVALILAGGRGTRLHPLTRRRCKPAVPFGGSFRIIDFTLSNCINSGIRRVGVLTQYEQHSLIKHLQETWSISQCDNSEFIDILPAQQGHSDNWYRGTADAITQNSEFLQRESPAYTLILAGDHIYKADYRRMIEQHMASNADVTIACCEVPIESAGQFGIVETDTRNRIVRFAEKPGYPVSMRGRPDVAQASMGLYLFKTELLLACLSADHQNPDSSHDFGSDIIPSLISSHRIMAYEFEQSQSEGYWRDVGTLDAFYEANMQLLDPVPSMQLHSRDWPIHTRNRCALPAKFTADDTGQTGLATDCIVGSGCVLRGSYVRHSILFSGVQIDARSQVDQSLILPGAVVGKRCRIKNAIIDSRVCIEDDTEIGYDTYADALRYRISENGVVIVTANDHADPAVAPSANAVSSLPGKHRSLVE